jgi:3-oxoacyl-[acyl-carrier-protein] synthase-3
MDEFEGRLEGDAADPQAHARAVRACRLSRLPGQPAPAGEGRLALDVARRSSIGEEHLELRSTLMKHAVTEHRDFRMLEAGLRGERRALARSRAREEHRLRGAVGLDVPRGVAGPIRSGCSAPMFIIEGLGSIKAQEWGSWRSAASACPRMPSSSCSITARTTPST